MRVMTWTRPESQPLARKMVSPGRTGLLALAALLAGAVCAASASAVSVAAQTCPASGCGEPAFNEFFPFIKRVGYDPTATDPFTFRYYNKHEARRMRKQLL
jgi:hypothetical protein